MKKQMQQFKGVSPIKRDKNQDEESSQYGHNCGGMQSGSSFSPDKNSSSIRSLSDLNGGFRFMQGPIKDRRSSSLMSLTTPKIVLGGHSRIKSCIFGQ